MILDDDTTEEELDEPIGYWPSPEAEEELDRLAGLLEPEQAPELVPDVDNGPAMTWAEIGAELDIHPDTARKIGERALAKLRRGNAFARLGVA